MDLVKTKSKLDSLPHNGLEQERTALSLILLQGRIFYTTLTGKSLTYDQSLSYRSMLLWTYFEATSDLILKFWWLGPSAVT